MLPFFCFSARHTYDLHLYFLRRICKNGCKHSATTFLSVIEPCGADNVSVRNANWNGNSFCNVGCVNVVFGEISMSNSIDLCNLFRAPCDNVPSLYACRITPLLKLSLERLCVLGLSTGKENVIMRLCLILAMGIDLVSNISD